VTEKIRRNFAVTLERAATGDDRLVGGCCVPYNRPTKVSDGGPPYMEMFVPGVFGHQLGAAHSVELRYQHQDDLLSRIGHGVNLEERADGLWGTFRVFAGTPGDQALALVDAGLLTGLSIFGTVRRSARGSDGTVVRQRVDLEHVGLVDTPAYGEARVALRRSRADFDLPELPDDEQLARLRAVGITIA